MPSSWTRNDGERSGHFDGKAEPLDEIYDKIKQDDRPWLEKVLRDRWQRSQDSVAGQEDDQPATTSQPGSFGPLDVTAAVLGSAVKPSRSLTRFRNHDWSTSALGPMSAWPVELRSIVNMCLTDPRGVAVWWGPKRTCIFNDDYETLLGGKAEWATGESLHTVWAEKDDAIIRALAGFEQVFATSQPIFGDDQEFFVERSGFLEEMWASWAVIPILSPSGTVGVYNPCSESTEDVLQARRKATLQALFRETSSHASTIGEYWLAVLAGLEENSYDVPFATLYARSDSTNEDDGGNVQLASGSTQATWILQGSLQATPQAVEMPASLSLDLAAQTFGPMLEQATNTMQIRWLHAADSDLTLTLLKALVSRRWGDACRSAVIIPIGQQQLCDGFLVLGINPRCHLNNDYRTFIASIESQLQQSLHSLRVHLQSQHNVSREIALVQKEQALLARELDLSRSDARDKEQRFRRMADKSVVGMFEVGVDGKLNYANQAWFDITGFPACNLNELPPLTWLSIFHPDDKEGFIGRWGQMASGEKLAFEIRMSKPFLSEVHSSGEMVTGDTWVSAYGYGEFNAQGEIVNVLGSIADISRHKWMEDFQQRRTAEALELKRQQESFMDMTSHEARNPLAAISLCTENISTTCKDILISTGDSLVTHRTNIESILDAAGIISTCVTHQTSVIDDVLMLSKLKSGMLPIYATQMQPLREVEETLKVVDAQVQEARISLDLVVDRSFNDLGIDTVLLDPVRLRQILLNLLTNAIKFTSPEAARHIMVNVSIFNAPPSSALDRMTKLGNDYDKKVETQPSERDVYLLISVSDTGCGIDPSSLDSLFNRFKQGSPKTHIKYGGSGLGLYICKELSRLQGGQIGVVSTVGSGTTFSFYVKGQKCPVDTTPHERDAESTLSTAKADNQARGRLLRLKSTDASSMRARHVLIVEDNLINQQVMAKQIRKAGLMVSVANNGVEALQHLCTTHFIKEGGAQLDIILMDIEMPVMDGLECTRRIREMQLEGAVRGEVPIVAVTANARDEQKQSALDAGCNTIITKPFRIKALLETIDQFSFD